MKIGVTSDLHGFLPPIEPCEVLCICGDIIPLQIQRSLSESKIWFKENFSEWCESIPVSEVVLIGGNHDFYLASTVMKSNSEIFNSDKIKKLENSYVVIMDENGNQKTFYGTPDCKLFGNWAYMYSSEMLQKMYDNILENVDVLLSHDAPKIHDLGKIMEGQHSGYDAGNPWLADAILNKNPKYAFCGHIHSGEHSLVLLPNGTYAANVSFVNEHYKPTNKVLYLNI